MQIQQVKCLFIHLTEALITIVNQVSQGFQVSTPLSFMTIAMTANISRALLQLFSSF